MNSDKVFIDTAAWIALLNSRDTLHQPALKVMTGLQQQNLFLVTTEFVLLEVADALSQPSLRGRTIEFVESLPEFSALKKELADVEAPADAACCSAQKA